MLQMNRIHTRFVVCAGLLLQTLSLAHAQVTVSENTNIDMSTVRTWPAGPYSQVITNSGVLQTQIQLFNVAGPGGTSLSYSIYNRTNQTYNSPIVARDGDVGKGWTQSAINAAASDTKDFVQNKSGNIVNKWHLDGVVIQGNGQPNVYNYSRRPGTHNDIVPEQNAVPQVTGFNITEQSDKSVWYYHEPVLAQQNYRLTTITDTHGNVITYTYDANHLPIQVTDASNDRYYKISYTTRTLSYPNAQVSQVQLYYPGGSRTWGFTYNADQTLQKITYPDPITGNPGPTITFGYDTTINTSTNLTDITDLKGNHWHYVQGLMYSTLTQVGVTEVDEPQNTPTFGSWHSDYYTRFAYSIYSPDGSQPSTWNYTCAITDQLGRVWKHIYYNGYDINTGDYIGTPIEEVDDPTVTTNGDNDNFSEKFYWNTGGVNPTTGATDPNDNTLNSYTDKSGQLWKFTYDANNRGLMTSKTDPLLHQTQFLYNNSNQRLIRTIDANNDRTLYFYDPLTLDLTKTIVDPTTDPNDGTYSKPSGVALTTNVTYTPHGEIASTWSGTDAPTTYSNYDAYGNAQTITPPSGFATTKVFDALNNVTSITEPSPGDKTSFLYDQWNRLTKTTYPPTTNPSTAQIAYDNNGNVTSTTNENGVVTSMSYDELNRLVTTRRPVDSNSANDIVTTNGYDKVGNRTSVLNGRLKTTTYTYDERHELTKITYPDTTTRKMGYDPDGQVDRRWDGQNRLTTYDYDAAHRLWHTYYPTSTITNTWRADNVLTGLNDALGTTNWTVNGANQVTQVYQPYSGKTVYYTYDTAGRKKTMQLDTQTWTYNYNSALQLQTVNQTIGDSVAASYGYYNNGSVSFRTMGTNLRTRFTYDTRGRTTVISHLALSGSTETEQQHVGYVFDDAGNVLTYSDQVIGGPTQSTSYIYDWANRLGKETRTGAGGNQFTNIYNYDKNGNRTSVIGDNVTSNYTVDNNDKFSSGDGYSVSSYDADGNPQNLSVALPADDARNNFSTASNPTGNWKYGYETSVGSAFTAFTNSAQIFGPSLDTWNIASGTAVPMVTKNSLSTTQSYCDVMQPFNILNLYPSTSYRSSVRWTAPALGTATITGQFQGLSIEGVTTDVAVSLTHGAITNTIPSGTNTLTGPAPASSNTLSLNLTQQVSAGDVLDFSVGAGSGGGIHADSTGLQASISLSASYTFAYDYENRLTSVTGPLGTSTYTIDGLGHRVGKLASSVQTNYVYDGDTIIAEITPSGTTYHVPGVGFVSSGIQSYYQENGLGSTLSVRNSAGTLSSRNEYDAYGTTYPVVMGTQSAFRFAGSHGYVSDDDTNMQLLGHRYYVPRIGRFLTQDPSGQADDLNLYAYCRNNPLVGTDPTGLVFVISGPDQSMWKDARSYLSKYGPMKKIINTLSNDPDFSVSINIDRTMRRNIDGIPNYQLDPVLNWNPYLGINAEDNDGNPTGITINPTIVLGHELVHFYHIYQDMKNHTQTTSRLANALLPYWTNQEEKRTTKFEQVMAAFLGAGQRYNHQGKFAWVTGPISANLAH